MITCVALVVVAACTPRGARAARCAFCGMRIAEGSHWTSGAVASDGRALAFDTPGCLFRYRVSSRGGGTHDEWAIEYYGAASTHAAARGLRYAIGGDVTGPMGPDLVPIAPERVDAFRRDHHARDIVTFDAIDASVLSHL